MALSVDSFAQGCRRPRSRIEGWPKQDEVRAKLGGWIAGRVVAVVDECPLLNAAKADR